MNNGGRNSYFLVTNHKAGGHNLDRRKYRKKGVKKIDKGVESAGEARIDLQKGE